MATRRGCDCPRGQLNLKLTKIDYSFIRSHSEAHHLAAVAQPIPAASNPETNKNGASEGIVGSAEANAAATLGLLTSVANSVNQQQQQQQQQQAQQQQPSFTPINQPQASPGGSPGPQLGPCPTTPNPLPPGYNKVSTLSSHNMPQHTGPELTLRLEIVGSTYLRQLLHSGQSPEPDRRLTRLRTNPLTPLSLHGSDYSPMAPIARLDPHPLQRLRALLQDEGSPSPYLTQDGRDQVAQQVKGQINLEGPRRPRRRPRTGCGWTGESGQQE